MYKGSLIRNGGDVSCCWLFENCCCRVWSRCWCHHRSSCRRFRTEVKTEWCRAPDGGADSESVVKDSVVYYRYCWYLAASRCRDWDVRVRVSIFSHSTIQNLIVSTKPTHVLHTERHLYSKKISPLLLWSIVYKPCFFVRATILAPPSYSPSRAVCATTVFKESRKAGARALSEAVVAFWRKPARLLTQSASASVKNTATLYPKKIRVDWFVVIRPTLLFRSVTDFYFCSAPNGPARRGKALNRGSYAGQTLRRKKLRKHRIT